MKDGIIADRQLAPETMSNKVPLVTLWFWIIKIMATTVGETAADFLNLNLGLGLTKTSWIMGILLLVALLLQLLARRYLPWRYWLAVVFLSVFGTLVTDNLVDNYGVSLIVTTIAFSISLILTFVIWHAKERTLSIHSIFTRRREIFYWTAILFTFALGTAAGDLLAEKMNFGYGLSALVFGGAIGLVTLAYYRFNFDGVWAFWIAYVLTRPFGASCGDLLSQSAGDGGQGLGTIWTSGLFAVVIFSLVSYLTISRADIDSNSA